MNYDAIVIGAGLGGLTASAKLVKAGQKVLIIESHDKVGGYASCFKRKKYTFDSSVHVIPGDFEGSSYHDFYNEFQLEKNIPFIKTNNFFRLYHDNEYFDMPDNIDLAINELSSRYPKEIDSIKTYFKKMREIHLHFVSFMNRKPFVSATSPFFNVIYPEYSQFWNISIGTYLDAIFESPALKMDLIANLAFYHHLPYEMSFMQFMLAQCAYYIGGCYYIEGGSQTFSDFLKNYIEKNGSTILLKHTVKSLIVENEKITSVEFYRNSRPNELLFANATNILANAPMPYVYSNLLTEFKDKNNNQKTIQEMGESISAKIIFFGAKKSLNDLGINSYMNIFLNSQKHSQNLFQFENSIGLTNCDAINSKMSPEGYYTFHTMQVDSYKDWSTLDKETYKLKKEVVYNHSLKILEDHIPGISSIIDFHEVGSPMTFTRYTNNPNGTIYGFSPSADAFKKRSKFLNSSSGAQDATIKNLYYASAWSWMAGFPATITAGDKAANEILGNKL